MLSWSLGFLQIFGEPNWSEPQLRKHEAGEVACLFPLAWVPGESALNSCLWGETQAKAILVLWLLEVAGVLLHIF